MCYALFLNISIYFSIENWQNIPREACNHSSFVLEKTEILTMILVNFSLSLHTSFIISVHIVTFKLCFVPITVFTKGISFKLFSVSIKVLFKMLVSCAPYLF